MSHMKRYTMKLELSPRLNLSYRENSADKKQRRDTARSKEDRKNYQEHVQRE